MIIFCFILFYVNWKYDFSTFKSIIIQIEFLEYYEEFSVSIIYLLPR